MEKVSLMVCVRKRIQGGLSDMLSTSVRYNQGLMNQNVLSPKV